MEKHGTRFFLEKTYLDGMDDSGNGFILYAARLKWFLFSLHYTASLRMHPDGSVLEESSFQKSNLKMNDNGIHFSNSRLQFSGDWISLQTPLEVKLYEAANGYVYWNCHHPIAQWNLTVAGKAYTGLGYAETLRMTVPPWKLPIQQLQWGRFLSPGIDIIWIIWEGSLPLNKIFLNGKEFGDAVITREGIRFNGAREKLCFGRSNTIREVKLGDHLSNVPFIKSFFPRRILDCTEHKLKSAATYTDKQNIEHGGWAIYETVKWPT